MEQPSKVATPLAAAAGAQVSVAGSSGGRRGAGDREGDRRGVSGHRVATSIFDRDCWRGGDRTPCRGIARLGCDGQLTGRAHRDVKGCAVSWGEGVVGGGELVGGARSVDRAAGEGATPLVAAVGVQVSVPGPPVAGVAAVMARATVEVSVVTVLPPASLIATTGWVPKAVPPVAPAGEVVTARWVPVPTATLNAGYWQSRANRRRRGARSRCQQCR